MKVPIHTLKSGVCIMTRPILSEELPEEFQQRQPPGQPAIALKLSAAIRVAIINNARIPTEEEWLECFNQQPYFGGVLEWTTTQIQGSMSFVVRGGSWDCRINRTSAYRDKWEPERENRRIGFRLAFDF